MSGDGSTPSQYQFMPFIRRGASALITQPDSLTPLPLRASLTMDVTVEGMQGSNPPNTADATAAAQVLGPADVLGIDTSRWKTEPVDGTPDFEPNYFAAIDFDQIDFPWMFTPGAPNPNFQLMPWVALVVLADGEFDVPQTQSVPLPSIIVHNPGKVLPNLSELWAWAHVQISGQMPPATDFDSTIQNTPAVARSRIVCPKKLSPSKSYFAFLVPAFDAGCAVGLGQTPSSSTPIGPAWTPAQTEAVTLPFYFQFHFQTSDQGDFESLVRRLQRQKILPADVGVRPMDVSQCDPIDPSNVPSVPTLDMRGALASPQMSPTAYPPGGSPDGFQQALSQELDLTSSDVYDGSKPDPKVVPPFYGHWYVYATQVAPTDNTWLSTLNLDPRNRAAAGLGTQVVLRDLRSLLTSAWEQAGALQQANSVLNLGQFSRGVLTGAAEANLQALSDEAVLAITSPVHSKITASSQTVAAKVVSSALPSLALSSPFRRAFRPLGPIRRRQSQPSTAQRASPYAVVGQINSGILRPIPPISPPAGIETNDDASNALEPKGVPRWLDSILPYAMWLLAALGIIVLFVLAAVGSALGTLALGVGSGAVVLGILGAIALRIRPLVAAATAARNLRTSSFTPQFIRSIGPRPNFVIGTLGGTGGGSVDSPDAAAFRASALKLTAVIQAKPQSLPIAMPLGLPTIRNSILEKLDPSVTVPNRVMALLQLNPAIPRSVGTDPLRPIMWAPSFQQPMYKPLADWSQDLLLPGVGEIPPESLSLLVENRTFIESYMVGLNEEIERQLLWNHFPTDQRGTCFRQFWDVSGYVPPPQSDADRQALYDISPIHKWTSLSTSLGNHPSTTNTQEPSLILLIRGELLKRYPHTQIYAAPAKQGDPQNPRLEIDPDETNWLTPIYQGSLAPDLRFFGFNLTKAMVLGSDPAHPDGWFFVFQQIPGEPRFGLEPTSADPTKPVSWGDLAWTDFTFSTDFASPAVQPNFTPNDSTNFPRDAQNHWGTNSAEMAYITMRHPARVAILATTLLPQQSDPVMKVLKARMANVRQQGLVALQGGA